MYRIRTSHSLNTEPWETTYNARITKLNKYFLEGLKICIIIYEYPDTSTFRYRGYNISQIMEDSNQWRAIYFFKSELSLIENILNKVQLITISRVRWSFEVQAFIDKVKKHKKTIVFDIDDRVFDMEFLPLVTNTLNVNMASERDYEYWFSYISRIGFTASKADGFITTNDFLGRALQLKFHKEAFVIPNFLNKEQVEISNKIMNEKDFKKNEKPFTIGYFSGTPSHINDFKMVYKEIIELISDFKDINLNVVGFMEFPNEMNEFIKKGRITSTSLVDFLKLQELIASVDINIVPLVVNDFTNCKSELKYFEAAIVNTITCASPIYSYKEAISDGVNGFLCEQSQWYDKIKLIYSNSVDLKKINDNAFKSVLENYYGEKIIYKIENVYNSIINLNQMG